MEVLDYLAQFDHTKKLIDGLPGYEKYDCMRDGERFLLLIADGKEKGQSKQEFDFLKRLSKADDPDLKCIDFSASERGEKLFLLLSWIPVNEVERCLLRLQSEKQHAFGQKGSEILKRGSKSFCPADKTEG